MEKIIGKSVSFGLPKPDLMQTDPKKGDYVYGKEEFVAQLGGKSEQQELVGISVTEGTDGTVTMVNTLADGSSETIVIYADGNGNPESLTYNGIGIPIAWTEVGAG